MKPEPIIAADKKNARGQASGEVSGLSPHPCGDACRCKKNGAHAGSGQGRSCACGGACCGDK